MALLRYTLLSDGPADRALMPPITWCIAAHSPNLPIQAEFADFRRLFKPPRGLTNRMLKAVDLYPCDVLFVHRDAENEPAQNRVNEILAAAKELASDFQVPVVAVVTVRMQEAWFLFNESAIRRASGNPNGKMEFDLPPLSKLEMVPDPKSMLHEALRTFSGLKGRRLKAFGASGHANRVADLIDDFSPLRSLRAFRDFEDRLKTVLEVSGV